MWTQREVEILKSHYSKGSQKVVSELEAQGFERTNKAVRRKAENMNLRQNPNPIKRWKGRVVMVSEGERVSYLRFLFEQKHGRIQEGLMILGDKKMKHCKTPLEIRKAFVRKEYRIVSRSQLLNQNKDQKKLSKSRSLAFENNRIENKALLERLIGQIEAKRKDCSFHKAILEGYQKWGCGQEMKEVDIANQKLPILERELASLERKYLLAYPSNANRYEIFNHLPKLA